MYIRPASHVQKAAAACCPPAPRRRCPPGLGYAAASSDLERLTWGAYAPMGAGHMHPWGQGTCTHGSRAYAPMGGQDTCTHGGRTHAPMGGRRK